MTAQAARFRVEGRVQGVGFRASTQAQALQLDLHGYARNLDDGSVEVLAVGNAAAIGRLERWLWQGPLHANVTSVLRSAALVDAMPQDGFVVG